MLRLIAHVCYALLPADPSDRQTKQTTRGLQCHVHTHGVMHGGMAFMLAAVPRH